MKLAHVAQQLHGSGFRSLEEEEEEEGKSLARPGSAVSFTSGPEISAAFHAESVVTDVPRAAGSVCWNRVQKQIR